MTRRTNFIVAILALLAMIFATVPQRARGQEGHLGHDHSLWHEKFYQQLVRPDTKTSCCNLSDCRPTSGRSRDGHYEVKVNGTWVVAPQSKIIPKTAPDGGYHVCAPINFNGAPENLYCVIIAPEG